MKAYTTLSALLVATLALASPAPSSASTASSSAVSTSVSHPRPTTTATVSSASDGSLSEGSSANAAQASAIKALLAQSPEGPNAPNSTLIEILVTSDMRMYLRYQHAHSHYRNFSTPDGKAPPATGPGDDDDLGYSKLMEAIYGGQEGSLGDSVAKAWSLYRSYYGTLPTGVPSAVLSATTTTAVPTGSAS